MQNTLSSTFDGTRTPSTSRVCITGSSDEKKLLSIIPSLSRCKFTVIRQTRLERLMNTECEFGRQISKGTYKFHFTDVDNYTEIAEGTSVNTLSQAPAAVMKTVLSNTGKYIGPDCDLLGAKPILEAFNSVDGKN